MKPLVSIVIPTKNSSRTLHNCLTSVINQTYHNIELIIVDTQSNDNTINIARKYSAKIIETEWKLLGARYLGFKASKGDYILYLDSDQILSPQALEHSISTFSHYDMLCLEEESYKPQSYCIIYYQAYLISSKVGIVPKAVMHKDPSSIVEFFSKNYLYGKNTRELLKSSNLYAKLIKRNVRFRKGLSLNMQSIESIVLRVLKIIPFLIGAGIGRMISWSDNSIKNV